MWVDILIEMLLKFPWALVVFFYLIKISIQAVITMISDTEADLSPFFFQMGPDFGFMGITLTSRAILQPSAHINTGFTDPGFAKFIAGLLVIVIFTFTYIAYRKEKYLRDTKRTYIRLMSKNLDGHGWVFVCRILLLLISIGLGGYLFALGLFFS